MIQNSNEKAHRPGFAVEYRTASSILSHPDFLQARETYVRSVLGPYGDDALLNKLLMIAARSVVFSVRICLDAGFRSEDRTTWPTVANLRTPY